MRSLLLSQASLLPLSHADDLYLCACWSSFSTRTYTDERMQIAVGQVANSETATFFVSIV